MASLPGLNCSNAHATGQKHCPWGCAGLWHVLWGRFQRPVPSPGRYLAAEGAALFKTNCPTSAGLAPPGHRTARKRLQSAPPSWDTGRGSLPAALHVPCVRWIFPLGRFRLLARWSWFELKAAYTHLLTQRKCRLLTFFEPLGAMWHLAGLIWASRGGCPTPHISYTYGPSGPWPATP